MAYVLAGVCRQGHTDIRQTDTSTFVAIRVDCGHQVGIGLAPLYRLLSINQLGVVYEALLSYRGFFATEDLYEVMPERKQARAADDDEDEAATDVKGGGSTDVLDNAWFVPASRINAYKNTDDEIRRQAVALLEGVAVDDLDDGTDDNARYKSLSHGPVPILESCSSRAVLVERIKAILAARGVVPEAPHLGATCVMAESKAACDQLMAVLRFAGYAVESIEPDTRVSTEANCLLFATMHRAKGLECQNVIVTSTTVHRGDRETVAPQLIYVALTRAKQRATLLTTP